MIVTCESAFLLLQFGAAELVGILALQVDL